MIIGKNNLKEVYNPGELDFDHMTNITDHGDKVFIWASDVANVTNLPLNGSGDDLIKATLRYKEQMGNIKKDYMITLLKIALAMYEADKDNSIHAIELLETQEKFIWRKLFSEKPAVNELFKNTFINNIRSGAQPFSLNTNINRIYAEILVDNDIVFQRVSFIPNSNVQLFRVGRKENGIWNFSIWQGESWEYNFDLPQNRITGKNYIKKKYLSKDDVEVYFDSVVRWQKHEWNPNKCLKKGFYTFCKLFSIEEFSIIQNLYSTIPLYNPDTRTNAPVFITGNINVFDTYNEEKINNEKYRVLIQESEMLVQNAYFSKAHRIIKVNKEDINDAIFSPWEYSI